MATRASPPLGAPLLLLRRRRRRPQGKLEPDARAALIAKGQALKAQLESVEAALSAAEAALQVEGQKLPNLTHPDAPIGGEGEAAVLRAVGRQRDFGFDPRDHVAIGEALGLLDFEAAAEVSGSKFYYLKNAAALLELALVNYAMTKVGGWGLGEGVWGGGVVGCWCWVLVLFLLLLAVVVLGAGAGGWARAWEGARRCV